LSPQVVGQAGLPDKFEMTFGKVAKWQLLLRA